MPDSTNSRLHQPRSSEHMLPDVVPTGETVAGMLFTGLSLRQVVNLVKRFPPLEALMNGRSVTGAEIIGIAPDALEDILSEGSGHGENDQVAKAWFSKVALGEQLAMLEAVLKATFKEETYGVFRDRLSRLKYYYAEEPPPPATSAAAAGSRA